MRPRIFFTLICLVFLAGTFYLLNIVGINSSRDLMLVSDTSSLSTTSYGSSTSNTSTSTSTSTYSSTSSSSGTSSGSGTSSSSTSSGPSSDGSSSSGDGAGSTSGGSSDSGSSSGGTSSSSTPTPTTTTSATTTTNNTSTSPGTSTSSSSNSGPATTSSPSSGDGAESTNTAPSSTSSNSGPSANSGEGSVEDEDEKATLLTGLEIEDEELLFKDTNQDGVSDYDSIHVYSIDPIKPSPVSTHEGRKVNAAEKIFLGFDPSKTELVEIIPEEPEVSLARVSSVHKVVEVSLNEEKKVTLKGTALPNSFVTIYIYSTPIIVTVRADENGEWQYAMDQELENGEHKVYVATVNNSGKILAKSNDFVFVKTAEAATLADTALVQIPVTPERPSLLEGSGIYFLGIAVLGTILIFVLLIGLISRKKAPEAGQGPDNLV